MMNSPGPTLDRCPFLTGTLYLYDDRDLPSLKISPTCPHVLAAYSSIAQRRMHATWRSARATVTKPLWKCTNESVNTNAIFAHTLCTKCSYHIMPDLEFTVNVDNVAFLASGRWLKPHEFHLFSRVYTLIHCSKRSRKWIKYPLKNTGKQHCVYDTTIWLIIHCKLYIEKSPRKSSVFRAITDFFPSFFSFFFLSFFFCRWMRKLWNRFLDETGENI